MRKRRRSNLLFVAVLSAVAWWCMGDGRAEAAEESKSRDRDTSMERALRPRLEAARLKTDRDDASSSETKQDDDRRNPFDYENDVVDVSMYENVPEEIPLPPGTRVKGILRARDGSTVAILSVPGYRDSFFVRENDVVRIQVTVKISEEETRVEDVYLLVRRINKNDIEVVQKRRPDRVIIIR